MFGNRKAMLEMPAGESGSGAAPIYAGFGTRFAALMIDSAILALFGVVLAATAVAASPAPGAPAATPPAAPAKDAKPAAAPAAPAKPIAAAPAPAQAEAAPPPAPAAAPAAKEKPKAKRRAAKPKPAGEATASAAPAAAAPRATTPKYNDVMTAAMNRDVAGAEEILRAGAWVDRRDSNGVTALMAAANHGDGAMAELLLKHGADPNATSVGGSPLTRATKGGHVNVIVILKNAGAR